MVNLLLLTSSPDSVAQSLSKHFKQPELAVLPSEKFAARIAVSPHFYSNISLYSIPIFLRVLFQYFFIFYSNISSYFKSLHPRCGVYSFFPIFFSIFYAKYTVNLWDGSYDLVCDIFILYVEYCFFMNLRLPFWPNRTRYCI